MACNVFHWVREQVSSFISLSFSLYFWFNLFSYKRNQTILHPFPYVSVCPSPYHIVKNESSAENSSGRRDAKTYATLNLFIRVKNDFAVGATKHRKVDKHNSLSNVLCALYGIARLQRNCQRIEEAVAWELGNLPTQNLEKWVWIRIE